jgi:hypothetical protein
LSKENERLVGIRSLDDRTARLTQLIRQHNAHQDFVFDKEDGDWWFSVVRFNAALTSYSPPFHQPNSNAASAYLFPKDDIRSPSARERAF